MSNEKLPPIPEYPQAEKPSRLKSGGQFLAEVATELVGTYVPGVNYGKEIILEKYVRAPLEERKVAFHQRIASGLESLEKWREEFDPDKLSKNEDFISAVYEATQIAMRTSREEKRQLLVNAVINIANDYSFDQIVHGTFFQLIDRYSLAHIDVLKIFQNPNKIYPLFPDGNIAIHGPMKEFVTRLLKPQGVSEASINRIHDDLEGERMIAVYGLTGSTGQLKSMLNPVGEDFLRFISNPLE